jgi:hypothetical protein
MSSDNQQKAPLSAEHARLAKGSAAAAGGDWKLIGPYLAERAWGTVREDYSADGDAWRYFPFDHALSRAYRWSEDGLAGLSDREQRMEQTPASRTIRHGEIRSFYEYFRGETGEGLGASHQTGWTALAGALVAKRNVRVAPNPQT